MPPFSIAPNGVRVPTTATRYASIVACAPRFDAADLAPSLSRVYIAVRTELFQSFDERIKEAALGAITAVCTALSSAPPDAGRIAGLSSLDAFLSPIVTEGVRCLGDFDVGQCAPPPSAGAAASGCPQRTRQVW